MRLLYRLEDHEFPYKGYDHIRSIVRGIIYNDDFKVAIIHLVTDDKFGHRDAYETPGGGVKKGETLLEALKREILEEVGVDIDNIEEIGRVEDYYNLINRKNNNHYFLAHAYKKESQHLEEYEKRVFESISWLDIDEIISIVENMKDLPVNNLVKNRELPIYKIAKKKLKKHKSL